MNSRLFVAAAAVFAVIATATALAVGGQPAQGQIPEGVEVVRDVVYATVGQRRLHMDLVRPQTQPEEPLPVLIHIHGGAWRSGSYHTDILYPFAAAGYFTASIEYRLTQEAIFPAQIHDCKAAVRFLRAKAADYKIDAERIGVIGLSAGGHLAALLGTSGGVEELEGDLGYPEQSSRVQAVINMFGPTDITTMIADRGRRLGAVSPEDELVGGPLEENLELARQASPLTYVDATDPPFLILHGDKDQVVPFVQSVKFDQALRAAGVDSTFVRMRNGGHGLRPGVYPTRPQLNAMIIRFLKEKLPQD